MTKFLSLPGLLQKLKIGEGIDFECKESRDKLSSSLWETYSAFANTLGGSIVLGVKQIQKQYEIVGVNNWGQRVEDLWNLVNNKQKVNLNLLSHESVQEILVDGKSVIVIHVPIADRKHRPVYINGNPLMGTYKRCHEGDYQCSEQEVRQLLRDASDDPFDRTIYPELDLNSFDQESINQFKNRVSARSPSHPFLSQDQKDFLQSIGAWDANLKSKEEGPTLAGLLMLGKEQIITKVLPHHFLDYQEKLSDDLTVRWSHRIYPDGTWNANLFQFSQKVYSRLVDQLDVPFRMEGVMRVDESPIHEALREALVNTLIHADHSSSKNIKIVREKAHFLFSNPGRLRIPLRSLYQGGISDCRNPNLQKMFSFMGWGERAGSGFQKIFQAWKFQHWMRPFVFEDLELGSTFVLLSLISVIPEKISNDLLERFGDKFKELTELERSLLIWTSIMGSSKNETLQQYRQEHPSEITKALGRLVDRGFLKPDGKGRGTLYQIANQSLSSHSSEHLKHSSEHLELSSEHLKRSSEHLDEKAIEFNIMLKLAEDVRSKRKCPRKIVESKILEICQGRFVPLRVLGKLLGRGFNTLRNHYITPLLKTSKLIAKYPEKQRHPDQAYRTKDS